MSRTRRPPTSLPTLSTLRHTSTNAILPRHRSTQQAGVYGSVENLEKNLTRHQIPAKAEHQNTRLFAPRDLPPDSATICSPFLDREISLGLSCTRAAATCRLSSYHHRPPAPPPSCPRRIFALPLSLLVLLFYSCATFVAPSARTRWTCAWGASTAAPSRASTRRLTATASWTSFSSPSTRVRVYAGRLRPIIYPHTEGSFHRFVRCFRFGVLLVILCLHLTALTG